MDRVDDQQARDALTAERDATRARLDALTGDLSAVVAAATGSNLDDEHDPEGSTIAFEREQLAALRDQARDHLDEIERALARLAAGQYGICQSCGGSIGDERLAARPSVRTCVSCASRSR
jgi:RNA polymerase-binding transcription factor DksA